MKPRKVGKKEVASISSESRKEVQDKLGIVKEAFDFLQKYGYKEDDILKLIKKPEEGIPVVIFSNDELSCLESIVKYLKENRNLSYHETAVLLNRNDRTIWTTYSKASKKKKKLFVVSETDIYIPFEIFRDRSLGVLENICLYLKDECKLSYHEIAVLLRRDDRTIWTSYNKARGKKEVASISSESRKEVQDKLGIVKEAFDFLQKYGYKEDDILKLIKKPEEGIPVVIFSNDELSCLESIVKYLKENRNLSYHETAVLLNRNDRTIWTTYSKASKKKKKLFVVSETDIYIPFEIFRDRSLGVLENICLYLKDECKLSYHEIAVLLRRDDRTIWTSYNKARGKKKK